jgi:AraC family transcriptional regulator of arabinose operon
MPGATHDQDPVVLTIQAGHFNEDVSYFTSRRRGASSWLLIYTVAGEGIFSYDSGKFVSLPGDACLLLPRTKHAYGTGTSGHWELLWAHFQPRPHWDEILDWPVVGEGLRGIRGLDGRLADRLRDVVDLARLPETFDEMMAMNALEEVLIRGQRSAQTEAGRGMDPRVRKAMETVSQTLGRIHPAGLAEVAGLSESRFSRLFRAETGLTPRAYLEYQRINRARELLEMTKMPIREVSERVGFESEFYFSTRFRKMTGMSPRAYRQTREGTGD